MTEYINNGDTADDAVKRDRERLRRFLTQYTRAIRRKQALKQRLAQLNNDMDVPLFGIDYTATKTIGGSEPLGAAALPEAIMMLESEIREQYYNMSRCLSTIKIVIYKLPEISPEREILELRYIDGREQSDVCRMVFRCRSSCGAIEANALDTLMRDAEVRMAVNNYENGLL